MLPQLPNTRSIRNRQVSGYPSKRDAIAWLKKAQGNGNKERKGVTALPKRPERCDDCLEGVIETVTVDRAVRLKGKDYLVSGMSLQRCSSCGSSYLTKDQLIAAQRAAADLARAEQGLLTGAQIRTFRHMMGISQEYLEIALRVGPKTVTRWENGAVIQLPCNDQLLRVYMHNPHVFWEALEGNLRKVKGATSGEEWVPISTEEACCASGEAGTAA